MNNIRYYKHKLKYGPWFKPKKHWFDIHFYSLKAMDDFHDSRLCKFLCKLGLYTFHYHSPIGAYLWLSSPKDFENIPEHNTNLHSLAGKCKAHLFQYAKGFGNKTGRFLGILVTQEDYYYILMDDEGNKWYETCVGRIEFIKQ